MKTWLLPVLALTLLGQGCIPSPPTERPTPAPLMEAPVPTADQAESVTPSGDNPTETAVPTEPLVLNMAAGNFFFDPPVIRATPGQTIQITFTENDGFHTFVLEETGFNAQVKTGETIEFEAPATPGEYPFYCDIGQHRALGMEGLLTVTN